MFLTTTPQVPNWEPPGHPGRGAGLGKFGLVQMTDKDAAINMQMMGSAAMPAWKDRGYPAKREEQVTKQPVEFDF